MPEHTIAENLQRLVDAKNNINTAITNKGVTIPIEDDRLSKFPEYIEQINSASLIPKTIDKNGIYDPTNEETIQIDTFQPTSTAYTYTTTSTSLIDYNIKGNVDNSGGEPIYVGNPTQHPTFDTTDNTQPYELNNFYKTTLSEINSWEDVRKVVRQGKAPEIFPLGSVIFDTAFTSNPESGIAFQVVGYNTYKDANLVRHGYNNSLILCTYYIEDTCQICPADAFMYVSKEMPIGTYKFSLPNAYDAANGGGGSYFFTTTATIPVGGQLTLSWSGKISTAVIRAYANSTSTTNLFSSNITLTAITGTVVDIETVDPNLPEANEPIGTIDLGDISYATNPTLATYSTNIYGTMNQIQRVRYGANNYWQSGIRQYLNTATSSWWQPQTVFNRPHNKNNTAGFLSKLNSDFINVLAYPEFQIPTSIYEYQSLDGTTFTPTPSNASQTTAMQNFYTINADRLFLLSHTDTNLSATPNVPYITANIILDYYVNANNTKRIKYSRTSHSANAWWMRTPVPSSAGNERYVGSSGALDHNGASSGIGCVPACIIQ